MAFKLDPALRPYATDRQWEILEAWEREGSQEKAADAIGINRKAPSKTWHAVRRKAAKKGYAPESNMVHPVPDGFKLARHSQYYDKEGNPANKWVIATPDRERQEELFEAMVKGISDEIPREHAVPSDGVFMEDLMTVYPVGDHHLGMLSWARETDYDWDLQIGEEVLQKATDYLVECAPSSTTALIPFLGDFMHYDNFDTVTPTSKNQLDSDTRFSKLVEASIRSMRYLIGAALVKHQHVYVIVEFGNHDKASSIWLRNMMRVAFENEPRVTVDPSPKHFHYHRFGRNLIGTHHGDGVKMQNLPLLMATDRPEDWGQTDFRYWLTGHIHHSKTQAAISAQDFSGCMVESFRVLAPQDAWAHENGYRAWQDMKSIIIHKQYGEVSRNTVNMRMFDE